MHLHNDANKALWESKKVLEHYSEQAHIQKAEASILELLRLQLPKMRMLDIGVGAGRTTIHFAHLAKEYVGIDYAEPMVNSCRRKFPKYRFETIDVRDMSLLPSSYFDFVLFSHNGIDNISHQDRGKTFKEILKKLKLPGIFVFSTHNIHSIESLLSITSTLDPIPRRILKWIKNRLFVAINGRPSKLKDLSYVIVNDGSWNFHLRTHYIDPTIQLKELEVLGFKDIVLFSSSTGEVIPEDRLATNRDPWIYFLCNK